MKRSITQNIQNLSGCDIGGVALVVVAVLIAVPAVLWAVTGDYLDIGSSNSHNQGGQSGSVHSNGTIGSSNTMTDCQSSLAVGRFNSVKDNLGIGAENLAVGYMNTVDADRSVAIGKLNVVNEDYSAAIGEGIIVNDETSVIVGSYNDTTEYSAYSGADVAFAVGTGISTSKENGLIVYHDGTVVIPKRQGNILQGNYQ